MFTRSTVVTIMLVLLVVSSLVVYHWSVFRPSVYAAKVELTQTLYGLNDIRLAVALEEFALIRATQGQDDVAIVAYSRARGIREAISNDDPAVGQILSMLQALSHRADRRQEAASYWLQQRKLETRLRNRRDKEFAWATRVRNNRALQALNYLSKRDGSVLDDKAFGIAQSASRSAAATAIRDAVANAKLAANKSLAEHITERKRIEGQLQELAELGDQTNPEVLQKVAELNADLSSLSQQRSLRELNYRDLEHDIISIADVQKYLLPNEILAFYIDAPGATPSEYQTLYWVITPTSSQSGRLPIGTAQLQALTAGLRCGLDDTLWLGDGEATCQKLLGTQRTLLDFSEGTGLPFDHARSHELYLAIFGPFRALISNKKHLLVVPSVSLAQLPFHVLITSQPDSAEHAKAAWLAREHAVTVLPNVSTLVALRKLARPSAAVRPMIGFGNPLLQGDAYDKQRAMEAAAHKECTLTLTTPELRGQLRRAPTAMNLRGDLAEVSKVLGQPPLPETADELCAVARTLQADVQEIRLGARATEREVKALSRSGHLAEFRVVHFATHGILAGQLGGLLEPGLILTPPSTATEEDDGYLSASEIEKLRLDADWVVLSACNTGGPGGADSQMLSGLARAFFYAQARALLVSHWEVKSQATVTLITSAFGYVSKDRTIGLAEAMRRAMLDLVEKGEAHPAYWAPFVVVGEGSARGG